MFCKSPNGPLAEQYASKRHFDIKHLNGYGILTLKNFFKECVMVKFGAHAYTKLITNYSNFTVKTLNYDCDVPEGPFSLCS